jgi:hypothetical protein
MPTPVAPVGAAAPNGNGAAARAGTAASPSGEPPSVESAMQAVHDAVARAFETRGHPDAVRAALDKLNEGAAALQAAAAANLPPAFPGAMSEADHQIEAQRIKALIATYRNSARLLKKRMTYPADHVNHVGDEDRPAVEARIAWYEGRATVLEKGEYMPHALRTPLEGVEVVDFIRRRLADVHDSLLDLQPAEAGLFAGSLTARAVVASKPTQAQTEEIQITVQRAAQFFSAWVRATEGLLAFLGVTAAPPPADGKPAERWRIETPKEIAINVAANAIGRAAEGKDDDNTDTAAAAAPTGGEAT